MTGKTKNCAQVRELMSDAAFGPLSGRRNAAFETHLLNCARCREEFRRVQTLLQAIDSGVSASVAAEHSPQLVANVRQAIAEQSNRAREWWPRSAWLTAAGVCAALAICFLAVRTSRNTQQPDLYRAAHPANTPLAQNGAATTPNIIPPRELANSRSPRKSAVAAHRAAVRVPDPVAEPQVIVEPGQMQAILQLVAATRRSRIDGAELLAGQKKVADPLEIQPLTIAPLQIADLNGEPEPSASDGRAHDSKDFVSGRSN